VRFPFRELHSLEDAQRNFEQIEGAWDVLQSFAGAATIRVYGDSGAPATANGINGDVYVRKDGGSMTTVYQKRAGAWVAIL
jgi:hypothetical protein